MDKKVWLRSNIHPAGIRCAWHHCSQSSSFTLHWNKSQFLLLIHCSVHTGDIFTEDLQQHKERLTSPGHPTAWWRKEGKQIFPNDGRAKILKIEGSRGKEKTKHKIWCCRRHTSLCNRRYSGGHVCSGEASFMVP